MGKPDFAVARYNPFEWIGRLDPELIDEAALLADALVIKEPRDVHFTESARTLLKAIMLHVLVGASGEAPDGAPHDLLEVRKLAMSGENGRGINALLAMLVASPFLGGAISRSASMIFHMGDRELGSVISTLGRNTDFLDSPAMVSSLSGTSSFDPRKIKSEPTTIYLVLPEWRLASHSRWMRLVITSLLSHLQRSPTPPATPSTLLLIDEFAALGHMESIERAAAYIAGFGVKLVTVLQDFTQLKALYGPRWETFIGNAGVIIAFANADATTAEYLSKRCGQTEVVKLERNVSDSSSYGRTSAGILQRIEAVFTGHGASKFGAQTAQSGGGRSESTTPRITPSALITPDEVMVHFARETGAMMVLINGARPIRLNRIRYWDDPLFAKLAAPSPFHRT